MIDLAAYRDSGLARAPAAFAPHEIDAINARIDRHLTSSDYGVVREQGSALVRAVHGLHLADEYFARLCADPRLTRAVAAILGDSFYVHQFKVNMKAARHGESWPWHQDFIFWERLDGIARPDMVNVALCLSDIGMPSGPVAYLRGSHRLGNLCSHVGSRTSWMSDVGHDLSFQIAPNLFDAQLAGFPTEHGTGAAGDVTFFHPQLVHGSGRNVSEHDRRLLLITYNAADNPPSRVGADARPEFLCARDFTPISRPAAAGQAGER
jgi:ectoine hydroxylase